MYVPSAPLMLLPSGELLEQKFDFSPPAVLGVVDGPEEGDSRDGRRPC